MPQEIHKMVKRFGETLEIGDSGWYELTSGEKFSCDKNLIDTLWWEWVVRYDSKTDHSGAMSVFIFAEPYELKESNHQNPK